MPKDKQGNKLTWKQFFARWKEGINGITPIQKLQTQIIATRIQLLGIFLGLIVCILGWKTVWWLGIILLGALINTVVQYIGLVQNKSNLKKHEDNCEEMSLDDLMGEEPKKKKSKKTKMKGGKNGV